MLCTKHTRLHDLWHGEGVHHKTGNHFSTQKMGNIVPVFELRPAKVVVVDGIHTGEGSGGMHSCQYRSDRWLFSLEGSLQMYIGGVKDMFCCFDVDPVSDAVVDYGLPESGRSSCYYVNDK